MRVDRTGPADDVRVLVFDLEVALRYAVVQYVSWPTNRVAFQQRVGRDRYHGCSLTRGQCVLPRVERDLSRRIVGRMKHRERGVSGMDARQVVVHIDDDGDPGLTYDRNRLCHIFVCDSLEDDDVCVLRNLDRDDTLAGVQLGLEKPVPLARVDDLDLVTQLLQSLRRPY